MSAELLRQAATILRERAEAVDNREDWREFYEDDYCVMSPAAGRDDAQFIALLSPDVGLALADLLDTLNYDHDQADLDGRTWDHHVVPLARLIVGESND